MTSVIASRLAAAVAGRYTLERQLGQGGMATVYLAHDLKHDRKVAIKVLRPELAAVLGAERFVQEIKTTANLQHPNILPLFDSGRAETDEGGQGRTEFLYYVMPYIEGETLRDKLNRETQLGIEEAVKITTEVADALDYAHGQNVIHRDIKPENILLHAGRPLVADFGIALAVSAAAGGRMTETGLSLGTPHYMSPEQATADKQITHRSDIYSLGAVLYEMLTGDPPHTGSSAQGIILKIVSEEAVPVTRVRKAVPVNVAGAVAKALEKLPADRFESARGFAEALGNAAFRHLAASAGERGSVGARGRSRPMAVQLLTLATVAASVVAAIGWLRSASSQPEPLILTETSIPGWRDPGGSSVALSPDGTLLAFVGVGVGEGEGEGEGVRGVRLLDRRTLELRPIPRTEDAFTIFFSPDGQKVGFVTRQFIVKTTSLLGETQRTLAERATRLGADWGHDGYVYFAVGNTSGGQPGLRRVPANGGPVESLTQVDTAAGEIGHYWPQLLPGGRGVLFTIWRDRLYDASTMDIAVVDLKTRSYRPLLKGVTARAIGPGFIVVITAAGAILGVPFDEQRLRIGRPVTLREGVEVDRFGNTNVAASANGTLIYAAGAGRQMHELVWVDRAGAAQSVDSGWVGEFTVARVSPDGKSLAASIVSGAEEQIWVHDLLRDTRRQLRVEGGNIGRLRSWTPDGRAVAFWKGYTLTTLPVDGGAQSEWIQRGWPGSISFSPDGDQVVYTSAQGGHRDLYSARRGDSVPQPLVATAHAETGGEIAPDGRWLAYVSDESGRSEVYVRPFPPDRGTTTWPVTSDGGTEPRWSHTGRELFYRSGSNLMVAEVTLGATFRMGRHQQLFPIDGFGGGYDVGPDDRRFLMIRPVGSHGGDTKMVIVMDNVLEELKARTGK